VDPHEVLGVSPGAAPEEVAAAYRALAKRWHPDRPGAGPEAARRMRQINAAYDELRRVDGPSPVLPPPAAPRRARRQGWWLPERVRRALGPELVDALQRGEDVAFVTRAATWSGGDSLLAVTDRRLLWLLDDAVLGRVRSLPFHSVAGVDVRLSWPRRRRAVLRVRRRDGRRLSFAALAPATAEAIRRHVAGAATRRAA
jgi:hypothetical protein